MTTPKKPTLKDVRAAEAAYFNALLKWGENNLVTVRAHIRLYELREARDAAILPCSN